MKERYGIDYRNMHNGIHGLIIFDKQEEAQNALNLLKSMKDDEATGHIINSIFETANEVYEEINYHDIKDCIYKIDDDEQINIINYSVFDLY